MITNSQKIFLSVFFYACTSIAPLYALSEQARALGFVYLEEIDPTIIQSPRYATPENFVGTIVDGYKKPTIIMTEQAAHALKKAHEEVKKAGYRFVVYDAYRPQRAVDHFLRWSKDVADQAKKKTYYPRIDKANVLELGYVATKRSSHSRGSTVDLTLIPLNQMIKPVTEKTRTLRDGFTIPLLDDGTVDMGASFDLFDIASHYENNLVEQEFKPLRKYLKDVMEKNGFKNYSEEWWHFTLKNEPYPAGEDSSYFNFDVE